MSRHNKKMIYFVDTVMEQRKMEGYQHIMSNTKTNKLKIRDNNHFRSELNRYFSLSSDERNNECPIGCWDTSNVTDMSDAFYWPFYEGRDFNEDISDWDVSNVVNMSNMFYGCKKFNKPLNKWNMSKVENTRAMFYRCNVFNQPLDKWDVSNVKDMSNMFGFAYKFNQNINMWNVGNVENMSGMFENATFNKYIGDWDVRKLKYTNNMFTHSHFNQPIHKWNVISLTGCKGMIFRSTFNQPLYTWCFGSNSEIFDLCNNIMLPEYLPNHENIMKYKKTFIQTVVKYFTKCTILHCPDIYTVIFSYIFPDKELELLESVKENQLLCNS